MSETKPSTAAGDRLAKVIARAGLCSRRQAEQWIAAGRVAVNSKIIRTPAFNVIEADKVSVDGNPLAARAGTRVWLYHKPAGLVVTENDPEGRPTIFKALEDKGLPRVMTIGRLDINTEGLLLLTNDGGLKRVLELPATGWLRRYRVRAHGKVTQAQLDKLAKGTTVDGVKYGPIEAKLEREQGANVWMQIGLREGKNREIKNVLSAIGLQVNRLIRTSYGPFQLGDTPIGTVIVVRARVLRDQLGAKLAKQAGVDFDSPLPEDEVADPKTMARNPNRRMRQKTAPTPTLAKQPRGRTGEPMVETAEKPARRAPERKGNFEYKPRPAKEIPPVEKRVVHFSGDRGAEEFEPKAKRKKSDDDGGFTKRGDKPGRSGGFGKRDDKPARSGSGFKSDRSRSDDKPRGGDRGKPRSGGPSRSGPARSGPARSGPARSAGPRKGPPRGRPQR